MKIIKIQSCRDCLYIDYAHYDTFKCKHPQYPYPKEEYSLRAYSDRVLEDCFLEDYGLKFKKWKPKTIIGKGFEK